MNMISFLFRYFKLLITLPFLFSVANANDKNIIKIGTLLSYSGVYTVLGEEITNAMKLAFEEQEDIFDKKIEVIRGDTEVKPNIALQKARKFGWKNVR